MRYLVWAGFMVTMLSSAQLARAQIATEDAVVTIEAHQLALEQRWDIERLSVLSMVDGKLLPIPFQIDEINRVDFVDFQDESFESLGQPGVFDEKDQLLLMYQDLGREPAPQELLANYRVASAIQVQSGDQLRYAWLVLDQEERSGKRYVQHNPETGVTETEHYVLKVDPANELNWSHLGYRKHAQGVERSLIDTLKMRMSGGIMMPVPRITLDNNNLKPTLKYFRDGPIRSVMHLEIRVVFGGLSFMRLHVQVHRYSNHYEAHSFARIPDLYRSTLRRPQVSVSVDGNHLEGATLRTARGGEISGLVNGRMDAEDLELVARGLASDASWLLFDTHQGFALVTELDVPDDLKGIPLDLVFQDDAKLRVRPENFPGQWPNLGYALNGWPEQDELRFTVRLMFSDKIETSAPEQFVAQRTGRYFQINAVPVSQ